VQSYIRGEILHGVAKSLDSRLVVLRAAATAIMHSTDLGSPVRQYKDLYIPIDYYNLRHLRSSLPESISVHSFILF